MIIALILVPLLAGIAAFFIRITWVRRSLLVGAALVHSAIVAGAWAVGPSRALGGLLRLDAAALLFVSIASVLFLCSAVYGLNYLRRESATARADFEEGFLFDNSPESVFIGCLLLFLATMSAVCLSNHLGLTWVAIEATTLSSAPLIYFHRHHRSLEATWKYLVICSVGIALALLGNFFLSVAAAQSTGPRISLYIDDLTAHGAALNRQWLKVAFVFLLVGYGTKMGLAPLHTWLPDAHSEAPSLVSALLSGALLNCAFLGLLRTQEICVTAGCAGFGQGLFVVFGLFSLAIAAIFIIGQTDFKRMLAYSSVEHIGILALGVGLAGQGVSGAMFHAVNHSLTKGCLFLLAGNILSVYGTKSVRDVRGLLRVMPVSGLLWILGFLAITGSPPFGSFLSEFVILKSAFAQGHILVGVLYLVLLGAIFVGMASSFLAMAQGPASPPAVQVESREPWLSVVPSAVLCCAVALLGVFVPPGLMDVFHRIAGGLGGS